MPNDRQQLETDRAVPAGESMPADIVEAAIVDLAAEPLQPVDAALIQNEAAAAQTALHPLRFGMKAMLGAVVVCSVQFAVINYLGMLLGLAVGTAVCVAAVTALIVAAVVYRPRQPTRALEYMDQWAIRLTVAIVLLVISFVVAGGGSFAYQQVMRLRFESALRGDLGFSAENKIVHDTTTHQWAIAVTAVAPGGPFDQAGFRPGDVIKSELEPREFYQMLDENRGQQITLVAVAVGATADISGLPERQLSVVVPR